MSVWGRGHAARAVLVPLLVVTVSTAGCSAVEASGRPRLPVSATARLTTTSTSSTTTSTSTPSTTTTVTTAPTPPPRPSTRPSPAPAPPGAGGDRVLVVGDSVLLAAERALPAALAGWRVTVDAAESRTMQALPAVLASAGGPAPYRTVVVHLCTNYSRGGGFARALDRAMGSLAGTERVVWVTCVEWSAGQPEANHAIRAAPLRYGNVAVADWAVIAGTPGYTWADGIHLRPDGQRAIAALVASAVGPA